MATTEPVAHHSMRTRSRRSATCGCTSAAWAPTTPAPRSRSSCAARAATSGTSTATATSTASARCSASNIGHGRADIAQAGADQAKELGFFTNWSYAHPRAIELAARIADLAPGDLNRVFFTSGGSEAVESAIKLVAPVPQAHRQPEQDEDHRPRDRLPRHDAGRAHRDRHHRAARSRSSRSRPAAATSRTRTSTASSRATAPRRSPRRSRERIEFEGPDTVAAVILEPVQNAGGCFTPPEGYFQRVREICDEYDVLLISDEVICSWGRLGEWFGAQRYGYQPDIITTAKGLTSRLRADGRGDRLRPDRRAVPRRPRVASCTASRSAATRCRCAVALANIDVFENEGDPRERPRRTSGVFARCSTALRDIPIVGDVARRRLLPRDRARQGPETKESFDDDESEWLLRGFLSGELFRRGLICRADDRGDPVIQLSPPLIAGPERVRGDRVGPAPGARRRRREPTRRGSAEPAAMLTVRELLPGPRRRAARPARRSSTRRSAGCTSPSCPTRRRGCRAASCC